MEAKHSDPIVYQELKWRIWKLERENKILKEENLSLKFINSELREAFEMRTTNTVSPWLPPKKPSRAKVPEQTQISLNNRFQGLQAPGKKGHEFSDVKKSPNTGIPRRALPCRHLLKAKPCYAKSL